MLNTYNKSTALLSKILHLVILLGISCELIIFFSVENLIGCIVSYLSFLVFSHFILKRATIVKHPLAILPLFSLFAFMYLPLIVTLSEGKPISFGMIQPIKTFILQLLYYCTIIGAFVFSTNKMNRKSTRLSSLLLKIGYFKIPTDTQIWILGFIGIFSKLYLSINQHGEGVTFAAGFSSLINIFSYAPISLLFKRLYNPLAKPITDRERFFVFSWILFLAIYGISSNSRNQVIYALCVLLLMKVLNYIIKNKQSTLQLSPRKILLLASLFFVITGPLADLAFTMVVVRGERSEMSYKALVNKTFDVFNDKEQLNKLKQIAALSTEQSQKEARIYETWSEYYTDNIFLARFCNYRVVDATINHADKVGYANSQMQELFLNRLIALLPQPLLDLITDNFNKNDYRFSTMDFLYSLSTHNRSRLGSFIVGGDVGLGFATFPIVLFFILVFIVFSAMFWLLDQVVIIHKKNMIIPLLSLMQVYDIFLLWKVANGIETQIVFVIWKFWYTIILYLLFFKLTSFLAKVITQKKRVE